MNIPDYISPVVGCRVWRWDVAGLKSVCGDEWHPGKPLAARCRVPDCKAFLGRAHDAHEAPQANCTCGIYAAKTFPDLRRAGYAGYGIHGEVYLWGTVVEHELGWRAQYACPKNFFLPLEMLPFTVKEILSRIQTLIAYGCDTSIVHNGANIPLWCKNSGLDAAGIDFLIGKRKDWYARYQNERTLKQGDRVAILGRGIAVVEQAGDREVDAVLWSKNVVRIDRKEIVWDERNMRWETSPLACVETNGKP
jgi:hypothetical protein